MDKILIYKDAFLTYLIATMKINGQNVINKFDVEKKLYFFYDDEEFSALLNAFNKIDDDKIVVLTDCFNYGLAVGLLTPLNDFKRYIINMSDIEAKMVLSQNTIIATMIEELWSKIYSKEDILSDNLKLLSKNKIDNQLVIDVDELIKHITIGTKELTIKETGPKLVKKKKD